MKKVKNIKENSKNDKKTGKIKGKCKENKRKPPKLTEINGKYEEKIDK